MTPSDANGFEPTDVAPQLVGMLAAGTVIFLALVPLCLMLIYPAALHRGPVTKPLFINVAPSVQLDPASDRDAFRSAENTRLSSYGWVDTNRKTLHIPVDRAMLLVEKRGLPGWPKP